MKNKLEHILLSILLGLSVLLGLSFWLDTVFNFNIFCATHWDTFAQLQASHTPISIGFYISFAVAIFIFAFGLYFIFSSKLKFTVKQQTESQHVPPVVHQAEPPAAPTHVQREQSAQENTVFDNRPPRLHLPTYTAQTATYNQTRQEIKTDKKIENQSPSESPYTPIISEIFKNNGYLVKPNPTISGFVPNLFAIGNNEIIWIGGVDCDIEKMMLGLQKLDSVFKETLEDIPININAFILDTFNKYDSQNENLLIFKSTDELQRFISEHPADNIDDTDKESFDSYSEYIDTIIQYIKNI